MKRKFIIQLCISFIMLSIFSSCTKELGYENYNYGKENQDKINIFKGPEVQMGNGKVRSWISINHAGFPLEIGIEITDAALNGLPQDPEDFQAATFILPLHQKANAITPFDHIVINWNVHGHEPEHVFDVPHFDFHFYMISLQDQMAIPPYEVAPAGFDNLPPNNYWPDLYVPTPGGVPQMGKHWVNTTFAPPFTKTMIYGSYNGKFTFVEPMIIRDFLLQGTSYSETYPQPHVFIPTNKFYPTKYNIYKDPVTEKHYVTLSDFVWR
jgi:hypothetical protein